MKHDVCQAVRLEGARADSLLGYLRGLAVLRLVSTQLDHSIRASWDNGALTCHGIGLEKLVHFFLHDYTPTPVLTPWNNGAGFDARSKRIEAGKTLRNLSSQNGKRWIVYQDALSQSYAIIAEFGDIDPRDVKKQIVSRLRSSLSDQALEWLDAAVLSGKDDLGFPIVLGTGGNDGNFNFAINFINRLLEVIGEKAIDSRLDLLQDALNGTQSAALLPGKLGQYSLSAGDAINPWDLVFAVEGAIAFSGSISRRFNSDMDKPVAPFQFPSIDTGDPKASKAAKDRGEIWLPQWRGSATYASLRSILRNGRVTLVTTDASSTPDARVFRTSTVSDAMSAAQAALTLGVSSGLSSFTRILVAKRNGDAYGATYVGQIVVADRPEISALARKVRKWVSQVSRIEVGAAARVALREYQEGMLAYAGRPSRDAFFAMLAALADLDDSMAFARKNDLRPLPWLGANLHYDIDAMEGETIEDRIARSIASIGAKSRRHRLRYRVSRLTFDESKNSDVYDLATKKLWLPDVRETAKVLFARAVREASVTPADPREGFNARFGGSRGLLLDDFGTVAIGNVDWFKVRRRLRAYSIVEPYRWPEQIIAATPSLPENRGIKPTARVPVALAALKTLVSGYKPAAEKAGQSGAQAIYMDAETAIQLVADTELLHYRALSGAYARLRNAGADVRDFRTATVETGRTGAYALALLAPAARATQEALWQRCRLDHTDDREPQFAAALTKEEE